MNVISTKSHLLPFHCGMFIYAALSHEQSLYFSYFIFYPPPPVVVTVYFSSENLRRLVNEVSFDVGICFDMYVYTTLSKLKGNCKALW